MSKGWSGEGGHRIVLIVLRKAIPDSAQFFLEPIREAVRLAGALGRHRTIMLGPIEYQLFLIAITTKEPLHRRVHRLRLPRCPDSDVVETLHLVDEFDGPRAEEVTGPAVFIFTEQNFVQIEDQELPLCHSHGLRHR
jgi:hypothetical protein